MKYLTNATMDFPTLLRRVAAFLLTMGIFALVLMFSLLLFAVILTLGLVAWGYLWWKTREQRKKMRMHPPGGQIIEGEVSRETEFRDEK